MPDKPTVIVLFADALAAPEVAWSLHDAGFPVLAVARRGKRAALARSRIVAVREVVDPAMSLRRSLDELDALLHEHPDAIVMPLDDHAVWVMHRLGPAQGSRICGATGRAAAVTLDKRLQFDAAMRAGFRVPPTVALATPPDPGQIAAFPVIVKPALAARVVDGHLGRGRASIVSNVADFRASDRASDAREPMLVQPHLRGTGEGLFGLALRDGIFAWSAHRRVRMMNPDGSGSSACTNVEPDAATCAIAERFLRSLDWHGMFMLEFLREPDGTLWFMELNGRPWGSMALARRNGFEYPAWSVMAMLDPAFRPTTSQAQRSVLCRHPARELIHLAFVLRGPRSRRPDDSYPARFATFRDLVVPGKQQAIYNWRKDDAFVFFADLLLTLGTQLAAKRTGTERTWKRRIDERIASFLERRRQARMRADGLPAFDVARARSVLFVCYGNINRSALAERYLGETVDTKLSIASSGFHGVAGRPADPQMVAVASASGVRLQPWSSRVIDEELVDAADLIFAMEAKHLARLHAAYPSCRSRSFLLGCLTPRGAGPLEIRDPFGGTQADYRRCFADVTHAVSALADLIAARDTATALPARSEVGR